MLNNMTGSIRRMTRMFFSGLVNWSSQQLGAIQQGAAWLLGNTKIDYDREFGDGSSSDIVMAIAQWKMQTLIEAQLVLEDLRGEKIEKVPDHPLLALLKKPNEYYDGELLLQGIVLSLALSGNGYCIIVPSKTGMPNELWWTPHTMIHPRWPEDGSVFISHYEYSPDGQKKFSIDPTDVIHFRFGLDINDPRMGLNPLRTIQRESYTDQEAANWVASLMRNGAYPGIIISPNDANRPYSPEEKERAEKKLMQRFTGDNRGKPLVMSGSTTVANFGWSPMEVDMRGIRRLPEERISAVMNLPAVVAGLGAGLDRSTFSNMAEAREMAYESAIIPLQKLLAKTIAQNLLSRYEDDINQWKLYFDTSNIRVLAEDELRKAQRCVALVRGGIMRIDEARAENNLESDESDKVYLRPAGLVAVPAGMNLAMSMSNQEAMTSSTENEDEGDDENGEEEAANEEERGDEGSQEETKSRPQAHAALAQQTAQADETVSKAYSGELYFGRTRDLTYFSTKEASPDEIAFYARLVAWGLVLESEMGAEILAKFKLLGAMSGRIFEQRLRENWADNSDQQIAGQILQELQLGNWAQEELRPIYQDKYRQTYEKIVQELALYANRGLNLTDEGMFKIIETGGKRVGLLDLDGDTKAAIFRILQTGRHENYNPHRIAELLASEVPAGRFSAAGPEYRAKMIARTEVKYAQNVSSLEIYDAAEYVTAVRCFDGQFGYPRSDPHCIARDGLRFSLEEAQQITEEEHPNGTLSWAPIVDDTDVDAVNEDEEG